MKNYCSFDLIEASKVPSKAFFLSKAIGLGLVVSMSICPSVGATVICDNASHYYAIMSSYSQSGIKTPVLTYNRNISPNRGNPMDDSSMNNLIARLNSFRDLSANWNGNGAPKLSEKLYPIAESIISGLDYSPNIYPTARDSIQFEYEKYPKYLSFEIFPDDSVKVFRYYSDEDYSTEIVDADLSILNNFLKDFYDDAAR